MQNCSVARVLRYTHAPRKMLFPQQSCYGSRSDRGAQGCCHWASLWKKARRSLAAVARLSFHSGNLGEERWPDDGGRTHERVVIRAESRKGSSENCRCAVQKVLPFPSPVPSPSVSPSPSPSPSQSPIRLPPKGLGPGPMRTVLAGSTLGSGPPSSGSGSKRAPERTCPHGAGRLSRIRAPRLRLGIPKGSGPDLCARCRPALRSDPGPQAPVPGP